jgi:hypothetical protein
MSHSGKNKDAIPDSHSLDHPDRLQVIPRLGRDGDHPAETAAYCTRSDPEHRPACAQEQAGVWKKRLHHRCNQEHRPKNRPTKNIFHMCLFF